MIVALFNPKTKTLHHPRCECGHMTFTTRHIEIRSWKSAEGRHVRKIGKVCKACIQISKADKTGALTFRVPPLVAES